MDQGHGQCLRVVRNAASHPAAHLLKQNLHLDTQGATPEGPSVGARVALLTGTVQSRGAGSHYHHHYYLPGVVSLHGREHLGNAPL